VLHIVIWHLSLEGSRLDLRLCGISFLCLLEHAGIRIQGIDLRHVISVQISAWIHRRLYCGADLAVDQRRRGSRRRGNTSDGEVGKGRVDLMAAGCDVLAQAIRAIISVSINTYQHPARCATSSKDGSMLCI